jgi:oligopeptide transport system substrate-binding protein
MSQKGQEGKVRRMLSRKPRLSAVLLALVTGLLIVGCGGGDEGGDGGGGAAAADQTLKWGLGSEFVLDPGLATDTTSAKLVLNIFDPLVKLGDNLEAVPSMAESWDVNGPNVVYHLRSGATWSNGDPVTAEDYEYAWKRALDPELASDYSYQLYGIKGAVEYNECEKNCAALRDKVAVNATDDQTLEVTLTSAQPWFIQQSAHSVFLPVHQATVEKFGERWTRPENIVTNGPFSVEAAQPSASITLVKNAEWRDAANVKLERVEGRIIVDGTTAVQSFEAGEVDVLDEQLPPAETPRLKETPEYELYPGLGTSYYGFNVKDNIKDINQRRAMSLAVDRQSIIDNITQANEKPATAFTPEGMPGREDIVSGEGSPWTPASGDVEQAKELMAKAQNPKKKITIYSNESPPNKEVAEALQSMWKQIGIDSTIKILEWQQFLEFLGPPPPKAVDIYRLGWVGDFVDDINFLELWTCDSGNNNTGFCDKEYDALVAKAQKTANNSDRYAIYKQLEEKLTGQDGALPFIPLWYITYPNLERETVKETFNINLLDQVDLTKVEIKEG